MALKDRILAAIGRGLPGPAGRVRRRLASEAGFTVPTVTLMIIAALGMAGVAVSTSIRAQGGSARDQQAKTALAVAEAGVDQAMLQFNRHGLAEETEPCAPVGGGVPDAEGWCPEVVVNANEQTPNAGTVSYRVRPSGGELPSGDFAWTELEVVSLGTLSGTTRRVHVSASSSSGQDIFLDADVQSKEGITLDSNSQIHSGSATNGDITIGPNAEQCGPASVGVGQELGGGGDHHSEIDCTGVGTTLEGEISLPPVNQGAAATVNDNDRLFDEDRISGKKADACWDGFDGNGEATNDCGERELQVKNNSSVTLGGTVYSFCKLTLRSNSSLYIDPVEAGETVKIYFDSPEACGYGDGATQLELLSNSRITSTTGEATNVALLFVGSEDLSTTILLNSNTSVDGPCEQNFVIYAPYSDIELDSNTKFCGAMAGKSVHLDSNAEIWTSSGTDQFFLPNTPPHYEPQRFVECTVIGATGAPDEGC
jgi:hypothetical protein